MEYVILGKTGLKVSKIAFGCWQASGWVTSDAKKFIQLVKEAYNQGINFFDTALAYGNGISEQLLNKALKEINRSEVIIASKFPFNQNKPEQIRQALEQSLHYLNTDYIDIYQQHWPDKFTPLDDVISTLIDLKKEGKIRAIGVCNWMQPEFEECKNYYYIDTLQPCYNLLMRRVEEYVLPLCKREKIAVVAYSPLCQGVLAGKFKSLSDVPNDSRKRNRFLQKGIFSEVVSFIDRAYKLAQRERVTLAKLALSWLLAKEVIPIVGNTNTMQLIDNIGAVGVRLAPETIQELDVISEKFSTLLSDYDTLWDWHPKK